MKRLSEAYGHTVLPRHPGFTIATGVVLGVLVSLSSVGAGALGITALIRVLLIAILLLIGARLLIF